MNNEYLGIASIDSLKISFDLDDVDIINTELLNHIVNLKVDTVTGNILEEKPIQQNSLKHQYDEYVIHFAINKLFGKQKLVVLVNSKLLEHNYMDGLSMANIETVYNKLMDAKVFYISFFKFLRLGVCSDYDIKKDTEIESVEEFTDVTKIMDNATVPQRRKDKGSNRFNSKKNIGIEWNNRTTSTYKYPFLKVYHKGIESKYGTNALFFEKHLNISAIKNVVRIEATIKNFSEQGVKYGLKDNTLISLLQLTPNELNNVIVHSVTSNLNERINKPKKRTLKEYSPSDMVFYRSLYDLVSNQSYSIDNAVGYLIEYIEPVSKSRMKKKLITIYESEIEGTIEEKRSKNISGFFTSLGWE